MEPASNVRPFPERGIQCLSRRMMNRGALVAFCDLKVNAWNLVFRDCKWFSKDGRDWIGLPSSSFTNRENKTVYKDLVEFDDKEARDRFSNAAVEAVRSFKEPQRT